MSFFAPHNFGGIPFSNENDRLRFQKCSNLKSAVALTIMRKYGDYLYVLSSLSEILYYPPHYLSHLFFVDGSRSAHDGLPVYTETPGYSNIDDYKERVPAVDPTNKET
jgi:hypothetical protein